VADHAFEHLLQDGLVAAEPDEDGPVTDERSVGDVAAKDLAELLLIGSRDVRRRWRRVELGAVGLAAADDVLLGGDRQCLPADRVVLPLLKEQDRSALAWRPGRNDGNARRLDQGRVLGAVDEAREIAVVVVWPADRLIRQLG
jgi:hypothetical protein